MHVIEEIIEKYGADHDADIGDICAWRVKMIEEHALSVGKIVGEEKYVLHPPDWAVEVFIGCDHTESDETNHFCTEETPPIPLSCTREELMEEYPEYFL